MNKFKVGQKVMIIKTGKSGRIIQVLGKDFDDDGATGLVYSVELNDNSFKKMYTVHDLEEVKDRLTAKEKEYLSNIIKPFKSRVTSIRKAHSMIRDKYYETIEIYVKSLVLHYKYEVIVLPVFKTPMYKNMEINKEYTLEELGL